MLLAKITCRLLISFSILLSFFMLITCDLSGDTEEISKELTNRMTESMNFTGGQIEESPPPESSTSSDYPQIKDIEAPEKIEIGYAFSVKIIPDTETSQDFQGVMVWIRGSERHVRIPLNNPVSNGASRFAIINTGDNSITVEGYLNYEPDLAGKTYGIFFALFGDEEITGIQTKWKLKVVADEYSSEDGDESYYSSAFDLPDEEISCPESDFPSDCTSDEFNFLISEIERNIELNSFGSCIDFCTSEFGVQDDGTLDDPDNFDSSGYNSCISSCYALVMAQLDRELWSKCYGCYIYLDDDFDMDEVDSYEFAKDVYDQIVSGEMEFD